MYRECPVAEMQQGIFLLIRFASFWKMLYHIECLYRSFPAAAGRKSEMLHGGSEKDFLFPGQ
jgi:hypothetical protein